MADVPVSEWPDGEFVVTTVDGSEVAIHLGKLLRHGEICISVHATDGHGETAYLQPHEARSLRDALSQLLEEGR